jgi:hypothetical protein
MTQTIIDEAQKESDGWEWAVVEIFGHRRHAGRTREEERFGSKMLRIDVPTFAPARTLFDAANVKPEDSEIVWQTHYYGGGSIFSYTLTDEVSVMRANKPYESPYRMRLPAPGDEPNGVDFENDAYGFDRE